MRHCGWSSASEKQPLDWLMESYAFLTFQGRTCRTASPLVDGIKSPGTFKFVLTYKNCCNYVIFKYFLMKQKLYNFVLVIVIDILKKVYLKLIITYVITLGIQIL